MVIGETGNKVKIHSWKPPKPEQSNDNEYSWNLSVAVMTQQAYSYLATFRMYKNSDSVFREEKFEYDFDRRVDYKLQNIKGYSPYKLSFTGNQKLTIYYRVSSDNTQELEDGKEKSDFIIAIFTIPKYEESQK